MGIYDFYNRSIKSWLEKNDIKMYSTYNKGKPVAAERFIRTSKNKIYKHRTYIKQVILLEDQLIKVGLKKLL